MNIVRDLLTRSRRIRPTPFISLAYLFLVTGFGFAPFTTNAADPPLAATGFNRDVVIENTAPGPPYTAAAAELNPGEGTCYYQNGLAGKNSGLIAGGLFTNVNSSTVYQLQSYAANNALVLSSDTGITNGILFLTAPRVFDSISILANSGNGNSAGTAGLTLHFNDGSTFTTNYYAPDWFNNNNTSTYTVALQGANRINISSGSTSGGTSNARLYETAISLAAIFGGGNKPLSSITFNQAVGSKANGLSGSTDIYALSGT